MVLECLHLLLHDLLWWSLFSPVSPPMRDHLTASCMHIIRIINFQNSPIQVKTMVNSTRRKLLLSVYNELLLLTATTESRAATANMSAQETIGFPHASSTACLISSTTSNPLADWKFAFEFFSLSIEDVESRRIEPSQP